MRRSVTVLILAMIAMAGVPAAAFAVADIGQSAPSLVVPELDGQTFDLSAERGKVVIVNFWATWCAPCREEMPALNAFYRRYHAQGLVMIGISADRPHDRSGVAKTAQSLGYPVAMMRDASTNGFGSPTTLPTTFIVDRSGTLRARLTPDKSKITDATLSAAVLPLLQAQPAS